VNDMSLLRVAKSGVWQGKRRGLTHKLLYWIIILDLTLILFLLLLIP